MEGLVGLSNDKLSNLLKVAKKIASWLGEKLVLIANQVAPFIEVDYKYTDYFNSRYARTVNLSTTITSIFAEKVIEEIKNFPFIWKLKIVIV